MARIVIALGGNALGNTPAEQRARVAAACPALVGLIHQGHEIIVSHGILFDFLREELALSEERANEVACQIEHIMTFEEIERLKSCRIRPFAGGVENGGR